MSYTFYIIYFFAALILSYSVHYYFLQKSKKYSLKKANNTAIRWGSQSKPVYGGFTFYVIFLLTAIFCVLFLDNTVFINSKTIAFSFVVTLSFIMGLADDIINTSPYLKLFVQALCAAILINFGIYIDISSILWINYVITVFWIIGIMNSINMLDNMDAITTLVSSSIVIGIIFNFIFINNIDYSFFIITSIGTLAALLSFIVFNWSPAKMYMGDNGSQFLGSFLATLGIIFFWNKSENATDFNISKQLVIVGLAFLIPIIDTTTVTINRLMKGKSPFVGGRDHTTHHLSYLGLSEKQIALTYLFLSLISVFLSVYIINFVAVWSNKFLFLFGGYCLLIFTLLYANTKYSKPK